MAACTFSIEIICNQWTMFPLYVVWLKYWLKYQSGYCWKTPNYCFYGYDASAGNACGVDDYMWQFEVENVSLW